MNKQTFRLIPAAAAIATVMAFGGQAYAQTYTTTPPVVTKDAVDPGLKAGEAAMPKTTEARDQKMAGKVEKKSSKKQAKAGKKAARAGAQATNSTVVDTAGGSSK
ncbi:MAG: hypothetical protein Q7T87_14685 [Polaromonas sp.]|nr:hypothetical protein [Polaromonas sp.]